MRGGVQSLELGIIGLYMYVNSLCNSYGERICVIDLYSMIEIFCVRVWLVKLSLSTGVLTAQELC